MPIFLACVLAASGGFSPMVRERVHESGQLRLITGELSAPLKGDWVSAAKAWASANRTSLSVPAGSTLRSSEGFSTRFGGSVHLVQQLGGVDVYSAKLVVTVDLLGKVTMVSSSLIDLPAAALAWPVSGADALKAASLAIPFSVLQPNGKPYGGWKKQIFPIEGQLRAGYLTRVPTLDGATNWLVAVDAVTGKVWWKQNQMYHGELDAQVYASSPGGLDAGVGAMPTVGITLTHPDGGPMVLPVYTVVTDAGVQTVSNDGGYLNGYQITSFNCCVNPGCIEGPDAGPKRVSGTLNYPGVPFPINYDTEVCERTQRAHNVRDAGNFVYTPVDPPVVVPSTGKPGAVLQSDPAHSDEFSEVHAFYHVNEIYDWVRSLSVAANAVFPSHQPALSAFTMRDERRTPAQHPAVWSNVLIPDLYGVQSNPTQYCTIGAGVINCRINLGRVDNAAFLPRENFDQLILPEYQLDVDTLLIFQGNFVDFGYDAPVLWHEFGHGTVYATANLTFDSLEIDDRSANNESGALHEGFADFIASSFGQNSKMGAYVGPRLDPNSSSGGLSQDIALRNLDNTFACPDVLWGEVHQDSQHFSGALWEARQSFFQGSDNGRTFDAAFYASLVSMSPSTHFKTAADIISTHVGTAFPGIADAHDKMENTFLARGVKGCSKVIDVTDAVQGRPFYAIGAVPPGLSQQSMIPGPYQMKIRVPQGASKLTVSSQLGGGGFGGSIPQVRLLGTAVGPITFFPISSQLTNDAQKFADFASVGGTRFGASVDLAVPCGASSAVYFTLASNTGATLYDVQATVTATDCSDAGTDGGSDGGVDGGAGGDGGSEVIMLGTLNTAGPFSAAPGCGCHSAGAGLLALLGALMLRRRARQS